MSQGIETSSINGRPILEDGSGAWSKVPYQVKFGNEFMSVIESSKYLAGLKDGDGRNNPYAENSDASSIINAGDSDFEQYLGHSEGMITRTNRRYYRDSRVGGNEALNCVWQFNCDDDIVYPLTMTEGTGNDADIGMGRVYAQTTELNQTIGYFTFGVPRYSEMSAFYLNMFSKDLIELNNNGTSSTMKSIARFLIDTAVFAVTFPIRAVGWIYDVVTRSTNLQVNRFYSLRTTMHLYYRYVDSILSHWLINTNIMAMDGTKSGATVSPGELPLALQMTGSSMYHIRARMSQTAGFPVMSQEEYQSHIDGIIHMTPDQYDEQKDSDSGFFSWASDWWSTFSKTALGASMFIGFRVNKDTDASESFSNSSRPNQIAEQFNAQVREFYNKIADTSTFGQTAAEMVKGVSDTVGKVLNGFGGDTAAQIATAATGGAFVDVPEMWSSSDFSKSHSISLQLRSPYGDPVSIFQSIMVPLACIIAGVMPRAAGANSYQQPFYCRYYVKGISAVSCGLIESVQIKRGASEFGWTHEGLPTAVDVNITIKDMSPILAMSMVADGYEEIFNTDSAFQEYMLTLAGVSLYDRVSRLATIKRHFRQNMMNLRNTIFNKYYWTSMLADSAPVQAVAAFIPSNYMSRR